MDQDQEKQSHASFNRNEMKETLLKLLSYNKHITQNIIDLVFDEMQFKQFQKDNAIYQKGQQIEELSFLIYGKIGMFKSIYNKDLNVKEEVLIQEFQKGGVLGLKNLTQEMSSFEEYKYISLSSCQVATINKNAFNQHLKKPFENFIRDVVLFLKQIPLFNCISYNKLQQNCYYISVYQAQRGQVIYQLEEPHRDFYVLLDGSVASYQKVKLRTSGFSQFLQNLGDHEQKILSNSINTSDNHTSRSFKQAERMVKIREFHQGEFFGEQEIIQNKKRQYTILSEGNCIILRFTPYLFQRLIKDDQECWNILQHQTQAKEKLIEQRNQKFQASIKIVNENNDLIINRNSLNLQINQQKNTNFKGTNNNFQFLVKQPLQLQTLQAQTDESINTISNQDLQFNTTSPKNPKSLVRLDSQTRLSNTQCSTHGQSLTSRLTESQQSPFSSSQASPFLRKSKKNLSMIPLQSLNIINENEVKDVSAIIKNSSLKEIDLSSKKNQNNFSSISPIQKPQNKVVRSLNRQWTLLNLNSENTVNTIQLNESKELMDMNVKKRNSSTNNILTINSPQINDSAINIQTDIRSKPNTQKRLQRPQEMKQRISSQDFIFDQNQQSPFTFSNHGVDSVNDLLKMKFLSGQLQQKNITEEMFQKEENGKFIQNMIQKLKISKDAEQQANQKQKQIGIIDKHTENFALNLKNVFYRVFNKKNITQQETQKGLEKQVIDEGIKKYIKLHSSIQTNKNQVDYLKQKRQKYNDQLANVIYGRVKNYVEKKKEDDHVQNTPRIITYKSPTQILQQGLDQYSQDFVLNEDPSSVSNKVQLKFPFSLTPLKYKSIIHHTEDIQEKDFPDDEIEIKSISSPRIMNIEYKQIQDQINSPIHLEYKKQQSPRIARKQQAEITQQVYPLNMGSESMQSTIYKSYSPNSKTIQSKKSTAHAIFRNDSKNSLKLDPSTVCLLKRHELNLSLKNKFHTVSRSSNQIDCQSLQNSGVFKVTQLKNNQQQIFKTLKQNRINNY